MFLQIEWQQKIFDDLFMLHLPFSARDAAQLPGPVEGLEWVAFGSTPSQNITAILSLCCLAALASAV